MSTPVISARGIGKEYRLGATVSYATLRDNIARRFRRREEEATPPERFWALKDVSFDVNEGDVVGLIGRNGAGKTTLLKILSEITEPTEGEVRVRGRIASLLEVGTGFHPELTGGENIYLNGAILGMRHAEIKRKFDEIVEFAEVERFVDTPVKRYSSGMYVRLAFAVAAHLEPEILLIDEVLAVGDAAFQKKCIGKMNDVARGGRTVLFVSHNMATVEALCPQAVLLREGRVATTGATGEVLEAYLKHIATETGHVNLTRHAGRAPRSVAMMNEVVLVSGENERVPSIRMGEPLGVRVTFTCPDTPVRPVLGLVVRNLVGAPVFTVNNRIVPGYHFDQPMGEGAITCQFDRLPLMPGTYTIDLYFGDEQRSLDIIIDAISFDITAADVFGSGKLPSEWAGPVYWPATWSLRDEKGHEQSPS